ncbi:D-aminoacyl-tRNA deacylase [Balneolaceae bacterium ANBcel3]|nr:D-aminoacyl-tRNA deacylase [Balneolaceae bacterium ANBcel3]
MCGKINTGLLILLAVHKEDTREQAEWVVDKCRRLRIFPDEEGKMNKSVEDVGGRVLLISQFTLYGEVKKGTRPSFIASADPEKAEELYNYCVRLFENKMPGSIETGIFAAKMDVALVNDGPVTLIVER